MQKEVLLLLQPGVHFLSITAEEHSWITNQEVKVSCLDVTGLRGELNLVVETLNLH